MNRGRHLCSTGRPSRIRWALAYIPVVIIMSVSVRSNLGTLKISISVEACHVRYKIIIRCLWYYSYASVYWATVYKRFDVCYQTVVCSVCLSVTLVGLYRDQTVGWIKTKLGMGVYASAPATLCKMGTQLPLRKRGTAANLRPMIVVAKRLDGSRCHMCGLWRYTRDTVRDADPARPL